jgi:putative metallohydrolase (TIGR04338 family)
MRDSQRGRCYAAEGLAREVIDRGYGGSMSWDATRAYVDRVMRSRWMKKHHARAAARWRLNRIQLDKGRSNCSARGGYGRLSIPTWARKPAVILHELAHCLTDHAEDDVSHGWQWARQYLLLVRHFVGVDAYNALRRAMRTKRVRYNAPRKVSQATREAGAARLRAWRAAHYKAPEPLGAYCDPPAELAKLLPKW